MPRIGIYAGTFDPVHAGHIAFALQAASAAKLDELYFLPERQPRHKTGVAHFAHRLAMLRQATRPYPHFGVLELPDVNLSVRRTLPRLQRRFDGARLVFLFGSDVLPELLAWPLAGELLSHAELVIGLRGADSQAALQQSLAAWPAQPLGLTLLKSHEPQISSGKVRRALRRGEALKGSLASVARYSARHWLYVALPGSVDRP